MNYKLSLLILFLISCKSISEKTASGNVSPNNVSGFPLSSLPEAHNGIAGNYPGDSGIISNPDVFLADDFESYTNINNLSAKWTNVYHKEYLRIADEPENVFEGSRAFEFTVPDTTGELSNTIDKFIEPTQDSLFLRYYAKFDKSFNVLGSSHNGCGISARYCCPGVPANGYNKFLVSYEAWRDDSEEANPGKLNVYVYHPLQRGFYGDHFFPTGRVTPWEQMVGNFGQNFIARNDTVPELGRWHCYELMVKVNTAGSNDGRIAMWFDGKLIADFPNLMLRATGDLKIDRFSIDLHIKNNSQSRTKKWIDNVVVARSYIGPMMIR